MNTPSVNIYAFAHKGLRHLMSELTLLAGKTNYAKAGQLEVLKSKTEELLIFLNFHAHAEDNFILTVLEQRVPGSTTANYNEHEEIEKEAEAFGHTLNAISPSSPLSAGQVFYKAVTDFQSNYLAHMSMEESEMMGLIWDNFTVEELIGMQTAIIGSLSPDQKLLSFKYMIPAMNSMERALLMGGLKAKAPADFFDKVMDMLQDYLTEVEHEQLVDSLSQPA